MIEKTRGNLAGAQYTNIALDSRFQNSDSDDLNKGRERDS